MPRRGGAETRLEEFFGRYPEIELELLSSLKLADLVTDGVDVAVRFGPPPASSPVAQLLLETRILTVAAPVYLERRGRPKAPADLITHPLHPVSGSADRAPVSVGVSPPTQDCSR